MDERRLSTADVLAAGILDLPAPRAGIPEERERIDVHVDELEDSNLAAKLASGAVLACSEYYGIPKVWKDGEVYRGVLFQYRAVTEDRMLATAQEALDWFVDTARACTR